MGMNQSGFSHFLKRHFETRNIVNISLDLLPRDVSFSFLSFVEIFIDYRKTIRMKVVNDIVKRKTPLKYSNSTLKGEVV
jgi:hypothetical protein